MRATKQHFEFIADVVKRARTAVVRTGDIHVKAQYDAFFIPILADELAETNSNFDREKFMAACGREPDGST